MTESLVGLFFVSVLVVALVLASEIRGKNSTRSQWLLAGFVVTSLIALFSTLAYMGGGETDDAVGRGASRIAGWTWALIVSLYLACCGDFVWRAIWTGEIVYRQAFNSTAERVAHHITILLYCVGGVVMLMLGHASEFWVRSLILPVLLVMLLSFVLRARTDPLETGFLPGP